jgi:hypothetical protein
MNKTRMNAMRNILKNLTLIGWLIGWVVWLASCGPVEPVNNPPAVSSIQASATQVNSGDTVVLSVTVSDADDDTLAITWWVTPQAGVFVGPLNDSTVRWVAPLAAQNYTIHVSVDDGNGSEVSRQIVIIVAAHVSPVVRILRPADGEYLGGAGTCQIQATAAHSNNIRQMDFYFGGTLVSRQVFTMQQTVNAVYSQPMDGLEGIYQILVRAYSDADTVQVPPGTDTVTVYVETASGFKR